MFGKKKKEVRSAVNGLLEIISISNKNVIELQSALGHLGDAVEDMHKLLLIQEDRIELLEKRIELSIN
jgi:hypothetical protein